MGNLGLLIHLTGVEVEEKGITSIKLGENNVSSDSGISFKVKCMKQVRGKLQTEITSVLRSREMWINGIKTQKTAKWRKRGEERERYE